MTRKQIFGTAVGIAVVLVVYVFVYQQFADTTKQTESMTATSEKMSASEQADGSAMVSESASVPDTVDGITASIESETALDLSALDDEETAAMSNVNQDSDSVTNLGTSYDENNL